MSRRDKDMSPGQKPQLSSQAADTGVTPFRKPRPCPICGRTSVHRWHPFCSRRCADIDLSRWLKGAYAIPVIEEDGSRADEDP